MRPPLTISDLARRVPPWVADLDEIRRIERLEKELARLRARNGELARIIADAASAAGFEVTS